MSNSNLVHISWYNKVEVIFMNDLSKMYQVYVNKELQVNKNEILNVARLKQKTLSFLHDLGEVCQDSRCFIFWEKEEAIHHDELLEHYLDGLKMLMSIGYELRIDTIKNHTEIPNRLSLEDLFLKIYQSMMNVSSTYSSQDYQNTIDDYFSLGFQLGIDLDEIIDHI
jgi:dimeric dUTPase (all-alpha-NTP-PPase superfamily)